MWNIITTYKLLDFGWNIEMKYIISDEFCTIFSIIFHTVKYKSIWEIQINIIISC